MSDFTRRLPCAGPCAGGGEACQRRSALTYMPSNAVTHSGFMRRPEQTSLEIALPTAAGALRRGRRSRMRLQPLRKPMLMDFQSWMQLTQGAVDAVEAAGKQGRLNFR